jgi:very-short-patch-repair endonuclease
MVPPQLTTNDGAMNAPGRTPREPGTAGAPPPAGEPREPGTADAPTPAGRTVARDVDDVIDVLAARQHGVVARVQLLAAGVSAHVIDHRLRKGRLRPIHRGVYGLGRLRGPHAGEMAAVLAAGEGALLSHRSAAALWGQIPPRPADSRLEVSTPGRHSLPRPGLKTYRIASIQPDEATSLHGVPIATPTRTLLDLAAVLSAPDLERALARSLRPRAHLTGDAGRGLEPALHALIERYPRRAGTPLLRSLLAQDRLALTRSHAEAAFLAILERGGLPKPDTNVRIRGLEVDGLFRAARLVVEIDGFRYHSSRAAFERDRSRDQALYVAGYHVIRFTWNQLDQQPDRVLARVSAALALAEARRS